MEVPTRRHQPLAGRLVLGAAGQRKLGTNPAAGGGEREGVAVWLLSVTNWWRTFNTKLMVGQ